MPRKFLTVAYDKREKFKEIEPLITQVHEFCKENRIPYIFAANLVVNLDDETHQTSSSCHLIGPETTPPELAVANTMLMKGLQEGMTVALMIAAAMQQDGTTEDDSDGDDPDPDFSEGPAPTVKGAYGHA